MQKARLKTPYLCVNSYGTWHRGWESPKKVIPPGASLLEGDFEYRANVLRAVFTGGHPSYIS